MAGIRSWQEMYEAGRQGKLFTKTRNGRDPRYSRSDRKLTAVWTAMLEASKGKKPKGFDTASLAKATSCSARYVRGYVLALARAGYLVTIRPFASPHAPALYIVGDAYRDAIAPQLAGGSGGGGRLGNMWKAAADKAPIATKRLPTKKRARK